MSFRRVAVLLGSVAIVIAACGGGASPTPGASAPASTAASAPASAAAECNVGVSWNNFQQPRWAATDKPNIQKTVEAGGATYADFDANLKSLQQKTDVETLINQGADVIILLAQDENAAKSALEVAQNAGVPVIAYDRLIEDPNVLYITFNNVGVGKGEADALFAKVPKGNYVLIKGDPGDPNASKFLPQGWDEAGLKDKVASGDIKIVAEQFTDAWKTETAQDNMEAIIDKANADGVKIDAVLAENDSTALGVVAALQSKNYEIIPVSGQDGDPANLQNLAAGLQYVDVWKNSNELGKAAGQAALQLCAGKAMSEVTVDVDPSVAPLAGNTAAPFTTPGGNSVTSIILQPTPLVAADLQKVIDGGWITKEELCKKVTDPATAPPACQ